MPGTGTTSDAERFTRLGLRAEELARCRPRTYQAALVLMVAGAYLYVLLLLAVLLGLIGAVLVLALSGRLQAGVLRLAFWLGVLAWALLRALWVRIPPPDGVAITRAEAPALFTLIEEVRRVTRAPRVARVVLTPELNASVVQIPRLGIFGWPRNHLTLGLPLLFASDAGEFRAILAHELGHLSGVHGRLGVWVYRVNETWTRMVAAFSEKRAFLRRAIVPFYKWFAPRFSAFALVRMRQHEYDADACARDAAGPEVTAAALLRVRAVEDVAEGTWGAVYALVRFFDRPPRPMVSVREAFGDPAHVGGVEERLRLALAGTTEPGSSHPALRDRLAAILGHDVSAERATALIGGGRRSGPSAAETLFGANLAAVIDRVDALWQSSVADSWTASHHAFQEDVERLAKIRERAQNRALAPHEEWTLACLTERADGQEAALPLFEEYLRKHPEDQAARFSVARLYLEGDRAEGVPMMTGVIEQAPTLRARSCEALAGFYHRAGDARTASSWAARMEEAAGVQAEADNERNRLTSADRFVPHDLPADVVAALRERLAATGQPVRGFLVKRCVAYLAEEPCYVLAVQVRVPWWKWEDSRAMGTRRQEIANRIVQGLALQQDLRVFVLARGTILRRVRRTPGAEIRLEA